MSISKKYKARELEGRRVVADMDLQTRAGHGIKKGGILTIVSAHYGLELKSDPCPRCGQFLCVSRVDREDVTLLEEDGIEYVPDERLTDENSVRISRRRIERMLKRMRDLLDDAAYASGTPEDEAVIEFGWQIHDLLKNASDGEAEQ